MTDLDTTKDEKIYEKISGEKLKILLDTYDLMN